jgi:ABC-type molybdate transport system permease subunit
MKLGQFSFKREPLWILALSLGPVVLGFLALVVVRLLKH